MKEQTNNTPTKMRGMEFKLVNYGWICLSTVVHYRQKTATEPKGSVRACWSCCPKRYNLSHVLSPGHPVFPVQSFYGSPGHPFFPFNHFTVTAWKYRFGRSDLFFLLFQAEWRRGEEIKLGIQYHPHTPPFPHAPSLNPVSSGAFSVCWHTDYNFYS